MPPSPRDIALIDKYFDGAASPADLAELDARLKAASDVADALADAGRLDAWLSEHFREEKGVRDVGAIIQAVEAAQPAGRPAPARPAPWRSRATWVAAAAAVVLLAAGAGVWLYLSGPSENLHRVLDGQVLVDGVPAATIPDGARVRAVGAGPAVIRLTDGSKATLEPASEAVLHGRRGDRRQLVELVAGGGTFQVAKGDGAFEVETALGRVTALGTEFSVRLVPAPRREKEPARADAAHLAMAVAVQSGTVQVTFAGQTHVLAAGQNRVFAHEGPPKPKEVQLTGRVVRIEPQALTIVRKRENADETRTVALDGDTKILVETDQVDLVPGEGGRMQQRPKVVAGTVADLKVGRQVTVVCTDEGRRAVKVLVQRAAPPKLNRDREENPRPATGRP